MIDKNNKEIIDNMLTINALVREKLEKTNRTIEDISYYKDFQFKGTNFGLEGAYIVKIKDDTIPESELSSRKEDDLKYGFIYEIYDGNNKLVASVNERGEVIFDQEYMEGLQEKNEGYFDVLDLETDGFELPEEGKKDVITLRKYELEKLETEKKLENVSKITGEKEIRSYSEINKNQKPLFDKLPNKQELDANVRVTRTETLADMIPEIKEKGYEKIGVVYSNSGKGQTGRFSFVGITKEGKIGTIDSLENTQGTTTGQTVTSINSRDGSEVEEEQVAGMVRINGRKRAGQEEMLSVKVGQYGVLEVDYVRAELSEDKKTRYLSGPIETQNLKPTTREVREFMDRNKNTNMKDELKRAKPEIGRDGETQIENIDDTASNDRVGPDDILVLEDGTETSIRKEAAKAKVSVEDFVRRYNERSGKTPDEKIDSIQEEYEEEYDLSKRRR